MIANNSILTYGADALELSQFYYSPEFVLANEKFNSLYAFLAYKPDWTREVNRAKVANTVFVRTAGIPKNGNNIFAFNETSLNDFHVGQKVTAPPLATEATIISVNPEDLTLTLNQNATTCYVGPFTFRGLNTNDIITLDANTATNPLSDKDDYYVGHKAIIDIQNIPGGLIYTRTITKYDANNKTITIDEPMTDTPKITTDSTVILCQDDAHPPKPEQSEKYLKQVFKDMYYIKRLSSKDYSPVIQRINWISGKVYAYYRDDINMKEKNDSGKLVNEYYVLNSFYQVFKCLWNNNGGYSTVEPYFVSGDFNDSTNIFYSPVDGYKWKYMFTVGGNRIQKFLDNDWIPVPAQFDLNVKNTTEYGGGIEAINVTNEGDGYNDILAPVTVTITGDGTGASAFAEVDRINNKIKNIGILNAGSNYTYANVTISSTQGANCAAIASISPIGGTSNFMVNELACDTMMVAISFTQSEDTDIPHDMQLRQMGIISNPRLKNHDYIANGSNYITTTQFILPPSLGEYLRGEVVYQGATLESATYTATCIDFDSVSNKLMVINEVGTPAINTAIKGKSSGQLRTILNILESEYFPFSGNIIFMKNHEQIQRSEDSIELFRILLKF